MSRFLKKRHYKLVLPGISLMDKMYASLPLQECITLYLDKTRVSYTSQDVADIQTMFLARYGQSDHTPNTFNLEGGGS